MRLVFPAEQGPMKETLNGGWENVHIAPRRGRASRARCFSPIHACNYMAKGVFHGGSQLYLLTPKIFMGECPVSVEWFISLRRPFRRRDHEIVAYLLLMVMCGGG
jgi:hypothetical protein